MTRILTLAAFFAAFSNYSTAATAVAPGDPGAIPGVDSFSYDSYFVLGSDHVAEWTSDTDAYSWDHPNLASSNPALGNQTGWTHLSRWVAFTLAESVDITIRIERTAGVMIADQNNPGSFIAAGDDLIPAFTLWSGFEFLAEDFSLGLGNPEGGHRWDNDGDETSWADQLLYVSNDGNPSGLAMVEQTLSLAAGDYTIAIAGSQPGAFSPGSVAGDLRKGFVASLTTIPEPGSVLLFGMAAAISMLQRRR